MSKVNDPQVLVVLSEISKDIKALLTLVSALTAQQAKADTRASHQLSQIAHKR